MTRSIIPWLAAVVGAISLWLTQPLLAADPAAENRQGQETWEHIKSYSVDKKNEAVAYGKKLMQEADEQIAQLDAKASQVSAEAKAQYDKEVRDLKAARANTAAKLDAMAKDTGAAWNDTKRGFADAYKDLQQAYRQAAKRFK